MYLQMYLIIRLSSVYFLLIDRGSLYAIKLNQSQTSELAIVFPDRLIRNNSCLDYRKRPIFNISQLPQPPISVLYWIERCGQYSGFSQLLLASIDASTFYYLFDFYIKNLN